VLTLFKKIPETGLKLWIPFEDVELGLLHGLWTTGCQRTGVVVAKVGQGQVTYMMECCRHFEPQAKLTYGFGLVLLFVRVKFYKAGEGVMTEAVQEDAIIVALVVALHNDHEWR
jgi:hypothetical protein